MHVVPFKVARLKVILPLAVVCVMQNIFLNAREEKLIRKVFEEETDVPFCRMASYKLKVLAVHGDFLLKIMLRSKTFNL